MAGRVHSVCHEKVCIPDFLGLESIFSDPPWYRHLSFSSTTDTSVARVFPPVARFPSLLIRCVHGGAPAASFLCAFLAITHVLSKHGKLTDRSTTTQQRKKGGIYPFIFDRRTGAIRLLFNG
jgi:hypothetical protein